MKNPTDYGLVETLLIYCMQFALPNYSYKMDMAGYILSLVFARVKSSNSTNIFSDDEQGGDF